MRKKWPPRHSELDKARAKKLKALQKLARQAQKERERFLKYLEKEKRKALKQ